MNQPYFIVVLAHSLHGRLRRIQIPHHFIYTVLALAAIGGFSLFGFVSSYVRMAIKVADYNNLRDEINVLRERYQRLESESKTAGQQLASLQLLANEVSLAYGIKQKLEGPAEIAREGRLVPTMRESLDQYNFLKGANFSRYARKASQLFQTKMMPAIWPVDGRLLSHFGKRLDPFSGEGAFHTGVDISAGRGTLIKATADGIVMHAEWGGDYGRLVVIDHGGGVQTYYAHMSRIDVVAGQGIRRGEIIGLSGATGRVTSPHLHYEVRRGGTPINPYPYLRSTLAQARPSTDLGF
ncbi:MAG: M23 family metallopeptidase [Acidobacteria bacterium]|nr:M23 family metallopeptidase [Acidobacteriota bacterium]